MMAKCRHKKLALVSGYIAELVPDEEPFESGVIENIEIDSGSILIFGHWCPKCEKLVDIKVDEDY